MNQLSRLDEMVDRHLGGLQASPQLLVKIKQAAGESVILAPRRYYSRLSLVACSVALLCITWLSWPQSGIQPGGPITYPSLLDSQPAGDVTSRDAGWEEDNGWVNFSSGGISISANTVESQSIYAEAVGGNFPMILVDNAAYRLLKVPSEVTGDLLAGELGSIQEFTMEPALSVGGIVSNVVSQGEMVYRVQGARGAMLCAKVSGRMRVFQRVSFTGSALIGQESLTDTLCYAGDVASLTLNGAGRVDDAAMVSSLMSVLLNNAVYQSANIPSMGQTLLLELRNGLTLQMIASDGKVSACGTWACPEFFEAFSKALTEK